MTTFRRQYNDAWVEAGYAVSSDGACLLGEVSDADPTPGRKDLTELLLPALRAAEMVGSIDLENWLTPAVRPFAAKTLGLCVNPASGRVVASPGAHFAGIHASLIGCCDLPRDWFCSLHRLDGLLRAFPKSVRVLTAWLGGAAGPHDMPPEYRPLLLTVGNTAPGILWGVIMPVKS